MSELLRLRRELKHEASIAEPARHVFFKTGAGDYSEHDQFIGVKNPVLRQLAKKYRALSLHDLQELLYSPVNEERLLALFILVDQYQRGAQQQEIYQFYLANLSRVNNWNLVDASAHLIVGEHLLSRNKDILLEFATSPDLWRRRVAMVATWQFIRAEQFDWTIKIATLLLNDKHDLIHKAVGWMLREMGKKNEAVLRTFLSKHAPRMPRTALRYAIEKFSEGERKEWLLESSKLPRLPRA